MSAENFPNSNPHWNFDNVNSMASHEKPTRPVPSIARLFVIEDDSDDAPDERNTRNLVDERDNVGLFGERDNAGLFGTRDNANLFGTRNTIGLVGTHDTEDPFDERDTEGRLEERDSNSLFAERVDSREHFEQRNAEDLVGQRETDDLFGEGADTEPLFGERDAGDLFVAGGTDSLFGESAIGQLDATANTNNNAADDGPEILDPAKSTRRLYNDPFAHLQREIWRPGDAEGKQGTDYYDRIGFPLPRKQRWRLFQTDIGRISERNQPPRFVFLDDCAASQVLRSDIPKVNMVQSWPHDFGGGGRIRARRPHRGRPAIENPNAEGNAKYYKTTVGSKKHNYFFTGEPDFEPVLYRYEPPEPKQPQRKKRKVEDPEDYNPRAHGHNQFTPKDLLVKHGAPSFSRKESNRAPRINPFLRRDRTPPIPRDRSLYSSIGASARISVQREAERREKEAETSREEEARRDRAALREKEDREEFKAIHGCSPVPGFDDGFPPGSLPVHRLDEIASISDASTPRDVPRDMSDPQRATFEKKLTLSLLDDVQDHKDVVRMALELARAQVKISEQARDIARLKDELRLAEL